jgi:hypothetical protein
MPEVQEKVHEVQEKLSSGTGNKAVKAAAAAAATTAAGYAVRKALAHDGSSNGNSNGSERSKKRGTASGIIASAAATSWDAAADVLLPLADEAAESAGKYVATHGPEILRERIVPKFIEAFNDAK